MPQTIREAAGYSTIARGATIGVQFVNSIILTRALGPENFGLYSLFVNGTGITSSLANLGVGQAISKQVAESEATEEPSLAYSVLSTAFVTHIIASIIFGLSIYGLGERITHIWFDGNQKLFILYLVTFPLLVFANDLSSGLFGFREIRAEAIRRLLFGFILLLLNSILILGLGKGVLSAATVYAVSQVSVLIWLLRTYTDLLHRGRLQATKMLSFNRLFTFALPLSLIRPIDLVILYAPAYVAKATGETASLGNQQAGFISLALLLGSILQTVLTSALFSIQGYLSRWAAQDNWQQIKRYTLIASALIIIAFLACAGVSVVGFPFAVRLIYGEAYEGVTPYFFLSLIIAGEKTLIALYSTVLYAFDYTTKALQASLTELGVYSLFVGMFIYMYGVEVAWGYLLLIAAVFASATRVIYLMLTTYHAIQSDHKSGLH